MKLYAPAEYWNLTKEAKEEICNGCGAGNAKFDFVPDRIYGLSISEVCNIHDYMYHVGVTLEDKKEADRVMHNNLNRLIDDKGGWLRWPRKRRALKYFKAVEYFGASAYWKGKNGNNEGDIRCL